MQERGPIGLLTGAGKGVAGLITKPTGAIVDLTSAALTTIQRCACYLSTLYTCVRDMVWLCCTYVVLLENMLGEIGLQVDVVVYLIVK